MMIEAASSAACIAPRAEDALPKSTAAPTAVNKGKAATASIGATLASLLVQN